MRRFTTLMAIAIAILALSIPALAQNDHKVDICHATGSDSNPYVQNAPSKNSIINGNAHAEHQDIIPPFEHKDGVFEGRNWDEASQSIWRNGCVKPEPEPTPTETETETETPSPEPTEPSCEDDGTCDDSCPDRDDCLEDEPTKNPTDCPLDERSARGYCPDEPGHKDEIPEPTPTPEPTETETEPEPVQTDVDTPTRKELPRTGAVHVILGLVGTGALGAGTYILRRTR